uniref:Uncharacterized protein n=1 Tax=Glossina palpalis gambiensis TaxID=67801 RepID=A0A1B0BYV2_9MUSC
MFHFNASPSLISSIALEVKICIYAHISSPNVQFALQGHTYVITATTLGAVLVLSVLAVPLIAMYMSTVYYNYDCKSRVLQVPLEYHSNKHAHNSQNDTKKKGSSIREKSDRFGTSSLIT